MKFQVKCPNGSSTNKLTIVPSGLTGDNAPIVQDVDGVVTGAEIEDLNSDGCPEIFVYVQSAGSGSYGSPRVPPSFATTSSTIFWASEKLATSAWTATAPTSVFTTRRVFWRMR